MKCNALLLISMVVMLGCADKESNELVGQKNSKVAIKLQEVQEAELSAPEKSATAFIENLLIKGDFKAALQLTVDEAEKQLKWMMTDKKAVASFSQLSGVSYSVLSVELDTNEVTKEEFALVVLNVKATVNGVQQDNVQKLKLKKVEGAWLVGRM